MALTDHPTGLIRWYDTDPADDDTLKASAWQRLGLPTVPLDHPYARAAWLPIIGPTSWVLWQTLAEAVEHHGQATWRASDLARAHGVARMRVLGLTLRRLRSFGITHMPPEHRGVIHVTTASPALGRRLLARSAPAVGRLHADTFPNRS